MAQEGAQAAPRADAQRAARNFMSKPGTNGRKAKLRAGQVAKV